MVVQVRRDAFRLVRQHDHALAAGALAQEWIGTGAKPAPLPFELVLGTALHDLGWRPVDAVPRRDPDTGGILSFLRWPREERRRFYRIGIDEAEAIHPWAGLLASLHYSGFESEDEAFVRGESSRRERLGRELGIDAGGEDNVRRHRAFLRLFDDLSLFACLAGPASLETPDWLAPERIGRSPGGPRLSLRWRDEETVEVDPFPFRGAVALSLPCRDLPRREYASDATVRSAWEDAPPGRHSARFVPPV